MHWLRAPLLANALPWLLGLVAAVLAARNLLQNAGDFGLYLDAGRELHAGGQDLFRPRGAAPYPYPHVFALLFTGLQRLADDRTILWLWSAGLGVATALIAVDLRTALAHWHGLSPWRWLVFAGLFGRCIMQNLTHGQLGLWVACLLLRGATRLQARRDLAAGGWFAAAATLKLTPLLFILALPCMGRWRAGLATLLGTAVLVLLVPWPFLGTDEHLRHLHDFYRAMIAPQFGVGDSPVLAFYAGPSVAGTFDYLLQARPLDAEGYRVAVVDLPDAALRTIKLLWSLLLAAVLGSIFLRARALPPARRAAVQTALTMLAMAFFSPLTRVYHLASALLPAALFCHGPRRRDFVWWFAAAVFAVTMPLRQRKLLGEQLWRWLDNGGLLHFGLVALLFWLWSWTAPRRDGATGAAPPPAA